MYIYIFNLILVSNSLTVVLNLFKLYEYPLIIVMNTVSGISNLFKLLADPLVVLFISIGALFLTCSPDFYLLWLSIIIELQAYESYLLYTLYKNSESATVSSLSTYIETQYKYLNIEYFRLSFASLSAYLNTFYKYLNIEYFSLSFVLYNSSLFVNVVIIVLTIFWLFYFLIGFIIIFSTEIYNLDFERVYMDILSLLNVQTGGISSDQGNLGGGYQPPHNSGDLSHTAAGAANTNNTGEPSNTGESSNTEESSNQSSTDNTAMYIEEQRINQDRMELFNKLDHGNYSLFKGKGLNPSNPVRALYEKSHVRENGNRLTQEEALWKLFVRTKNAGWLPKNYTTEDKIRFYNGLIKKTHIKRGEQYFSAGPKSRIRNEVRNYIFNYPKTHPKR